MMDADEDLEFRAMSYAAEDAYEIGPDTPDPAPYVGFPELEREQDSLLHDLVASAYQTYCTIHLVDYMRGRSPLVRSKRDMKVEGS